MSLRIRRSEIPTMLETTLLPGHRLSRRGAFTLVEMLAVMGIIVIAVIAVSLDALVRWAERVLVPWHGKV